MQVLVGEYYILSESSKKITLLMPTMKFEVCNILYQFKSRSINDRKEGIGNNVGLVLALAGA